MDGGLGQFSLGDALINITGKVAPGLNTALDEAEGRVKKGMGNILDMTSKVGAGMTVAGAGLVGFFGMAAAAAADSEKQQAQLLQTLKSTGGAAGMSADSLNKMSAELSKLTPFEDDAITRSQALLLTFTNVGKDVFPQAQESILDMSQALGQDLQSSTIQLGKALNDPIKGITALSRVGVSFTAEQKGQIAALMGTSKELDDMEKAAKKSTQALPGLQSQLAIARQRLVETTATGKAHSSALMSQRQHVKELEDKIKSAKEAVSAYDAAQKTQTQGMSESQRMAAAQKVILGELAKEFGGQARAAAETFSGKLTILKNNFGNLMEAIGGHVIPILTSLLNTVGPVIEKVMAWAEENPKLTQGLVFAGVALGGIMLVVGPLLMALPGLISAWGAVSAIMAAVSAGGLTLTGVMAGIGTVLGVGAAVGGIIAGVAALAETFYKLATGASDCGNFLTRFIDEHMKPLGDSIDWVFDKIVGLINKFKEWVGLSSKGAELGSRSQDLIAQGKVPGHATGGTIRSPLALVGERGPELVAAPGSRVFTAQETRALLGGSGGAPGVGNVTVNIHTTGKVSPAEARQIGRMIFSELASRKA